MKLHRLSFLFLAILLLRAPAAYAEDIVIPLEDDLSRPWVTTVHWSYLDMIVPGKIGLSVGYRDTPISMWDVEYSRGSFSPFFLSDIGGFNEDRVSVMRRFGNEGVGGFQWYYGGFYQQLRLHVGSALLSRLSQSVPSADLVRLEGLGAMIGFGYRWVIQEWFVIGIDAITYSQPFITLTREAKFLDVVTDAGDRDKIDAVLRLTQYFPRVGLAKLTLGVSF